MNGSVWALCFGPDGTLYAGGEFTTAGGVTANRVAAWNGTSWSPLSTGMDATVHSLHFSSDGSLYAGGSFTTAGGLALGDRIARWNGSAWTHLDCDLPGSPIVYTITSNPNTGDLYLGFNTAGGAGVSASATVTNGGVAMAYPVIVFDGANGGDIVEWIGNETTGKKLFLNYTMADDEVLTLDLRPGYKKITSTFRGNVANAVLPGSDFATWGLAPGANTITVFISTGVPSAFFRWRITHWTADGGSDAYSA